MFRSQKTRSSYNRNERLFSTLTEIYATLHSLLRGSCTLWWKRRTQSKGLVNRDVLLGTTADFLGFSDPGSQKCDFNSHFSRTQPFRFIETHLCICLITAKHIFSLISRFIRTGARFPDMIDLRFKTTSLLVKCGDHWAMFSVVADL